MKNGILNELISTMRERIPQDINLANTLADILCMGKEAVYRRLRGEVSFTIDEVALLSQKLGISIDQIVGSHVSNKVTFDSQCAGELLRDNQTLSANFRLRENRQHNRGVYCLQFTPLYALFFLREFV